MSYWTPLQTARARQQDQAKLAAVHRTDIARAASEHAVQGSRLSHLEQARDTLQEMNQKLKLYLVKGENAALILINDEIKITDAKLRELSKKIETAQRKIDEIDADAVILEKSIAALEAAGL